MDIILEFIVEILFRRILIGVLGHYTLLFVLRLFGYKKGLKWLLTTKKDEAMDFGSGCIVALAGFVTLGVLVALFIWIYYDILALG